MTFKLESVKIFSNYINYTKDINVNNNFLINSFLKVIAIACSFFILISSVTAFIIYDLPCMIKDSYTSLKKKNPVILHIAMPFLLIGTISNLYQKYQSIMAGIEKIKKISLCTVAILSVCGALYSIGYFNFTNQHLI